MRVLLTGAAGFIGRAVARRLLAEPTHVACERLTLLDVNTATLPPGILRDPRVTTVDGTIADPAVRARALNASPDCILHLAAMPGGAAEADYAAGWAVNGRGSMALAHAACDLGPMRFVYASTIAVFGGLDQAVDDATLPEPGLSYGAHKLMMEILLNDLTRRGRLDALSLRLPGIVARPRQKTGHASAFMSEVFHAAIGGERTTSPVSAQASFWLMSLPTCVDNLLHAMAIGADRLPARRSCTLPALTLTMSDLVAAIAEATGRDAADLVEYQPSAAVEAVFGRYPPLQTAFADGLGFRRDAQPATLVRSTLAELAATAANPT